MQILHLKVKNFRSLKDISLSFEELTALIGANNAGKSTILKAIEYFFLPSPRITNDDICVGEIAQNIEITLTFHKFTEEEKKLFKGAIIDGKMIVTRELSLDSKECGLYEVQRLSCTNFNKIREESNGTKKKALYNEIRKEISGLPEAKNFKEISGYLESWESSNPENLIAQKDRDFFGAKNVASGKLSKKTSLHFIPAVRDASEDATNPKDSEIIQLLARIAQQTIENKNDMKCFLEEASKTFNELSDPDRIPELSKISDELTVGVQKFYSDAKLKAQWTRSETINPTFPKPSLKIEHRGVSTELTHVGHGLQRAVLFTVVEYLANSNLTNDDASEEFVEPASDIIILVEEPEIYQHPSKQLVIYEAFKKLTESFNKSTGIRVQIIYTTHSEKFINMSNFNIARIVRLEIENMEIENSVSSLTLSDCSVALSELSGNYPPMSDEALGSKLHIFSREVCEGFFANKIILVEGVTDKAILEAAYKFRKKDVHQSAIAILQLDGKTKLDKPYYIFSTLGIPTYLIFDNDMPKSNINNEKNQKEIKNNILLQKFCGVLEPEEWPKKCENNFCAFEGKLEVYLQLQLGDEYEKIFREVSENFGLEVSDIKKTPVALSTLFYLSNNRGIEFPLFDAIIDKVDNL